MLSFSIPYIGEFLDVVWASLSAFIMTRMYKGSLGKISGIISFVEEFFPISDFIPSFTLTWIYNYKIKNSH